MDNDETKALLTKQYPRPLVAWENEGKTTGGKHRHSVCFHAGDARSEDHLCVGEVTGESATDASAFAHALAVRFNATPALAAHIEALETEVAAPRSQLRGIDAHAQTIIAAHDRWFATPTPCGAVCTDEMAAISAAALAIRAACRAGKGEG